MKNSKNGLISTNSWEIWSENHWCPISGGWKIKQIRWQYKVIMEAQTIPKNYKIYQFKIAWIHQVECQWDQQWLQTWKIHELNNIGVKIKSVQESATVLYVIWKSESFKMLSSQKYTYPRGLKSWNMVSFLKLGERQANRFQGISYWETTPCINTRVKTMYSPHELPH